MNFKILLFLIIYFMAHCSNLSFAISTPACFVPSVFSFFDRQNGFLSPLVSFPELIILTSVHVFTRWHSESRDHTFLYNFIPSQGPNSQKLRQLVFFFFSFSFALQMNIHNLLQQLTMFRFLFKVTFKSLTTTPKY